LRRGTVCTVILSNDYGKPRPAIVIQSDLFSEHSSVTVLPVTTDLEPTPRLRIRIEPTPTNGLAEMSDVMIDKIQSLPLKRVGKVIGAMEDEIMRDLTLALALFLGMDRISSTPPKKKVSR
jgi:mRNA interferase MazF